MKAESLSTKQLAGQRLMAGFDGTSFNKDLEYLIGELCIGGLILFARNLINPDQIKNLCLNIQDYAKTSNLPPMLIAIDQEGGTVARLKKPFTQFPGNSNMRSKEDAIAFAKTTALELKQIGVNMNMAPVLDVVPKNFAGVMAARSFGSDPAIVASMGQTVIEHLQKNSIMAVAKHFPGIGRTILDSHLQLPDLDTDLAQLQEYDLIPFEAAAKQAVSGIMLSHIRYLKIDPVWPASLSYIIAKTILRDKMGYNGVVITDDLDMGAIKKHYNIATVIQQILSAEVDIALICHKGPDIENARNSILKTIKSDAALKSHCLISADRILALKQSRKVNL